MNFDDCKILLEKHGQEHLLKFYHELTQEEKDCLLSQISKIDFELMDSLYKNKDVFEIEDKEISNINAVDKQRINKEKYEELGIAHIKNGELAVCSMAGGQGTRLGFNGPKGTFMLDLKEPISIFEIIINKLKDAYRQYGVLTYWYIMTSIQNHDETVKFFEENHYFNYDKEHIIFFNQGELPLLDETGKIAFKDKAHIFMAPDGNGGIFEALKCEGIISHMKQHGIKYLAIGNVDNILINMIDPILIGLMVEKNVELAPKSFMKPSPEGKWGVLCKMNGKLGVIEYTETPKELREARNEEGELVFGDAYLGCSFFDIDLLERIAIKKLHLHAASKKNIVLDNMENKKELNTYKFEAFIFDSFSEAKDVLVFRVNKDEEFAPIKNKEGDESPKTAIELYKKFYQLD
ncbi:MAG: UTP--glucose-1-phosphate uridylyltransferase [Clostridia bacterium]|nr:UTP--glucose-1-phosphate uridylyltransferase [Clostridia bacterium]